MFWWAKIFQIFFKKYFIDRIEKLHKMAFIYFFSFFEKIGYSVIQRGALKSHCLLSIALGTHLSQYNFKDQKISEHFFIAKIV